MSDRIKCLHIAALGLLVGGCATPAPSTSASGPTGTTIYDSKLAQVPKGGPADVKTVADIIHVGYVVINGPAGAPRQWDRDRTLYAPGATFVSLDETNGNVTSKIMTPEEYRQSFTIGDGVYETEVGRLIEHFGHVAQVRSVSVVRTSPTGPIRA